MSKRDICLGPSSMREYLCTFTGNLNRFETDATQSPETGTTRPGASFCGRFLLVFSVLRAPETHFIQTMALFYLGSMKIAGVSLSLFIWWDAAFVRATTIKEFFFVVLPNQGVAFSLT